MRALLLGFSLMALAGCAASGRKSHYQWGLAHFDAGRFQEAAHEFGLAAQDREMAANALFNQGSSLLKAQDYSQARAIFEAWLVRFPDSAEVRINLAFSLAGSGLKNDARDQFERAITLVPDYAWPYCAYSRFLLDEHLPEWDHKAYELLEQATRLGQQDSTAFYLHGLAASRLGLKDQALKDQRRALALDPNNQPAQTSLGQLELQAHNYQSAASHFSNALALAPQDLDALLGAGLAYCASKRYQLGLHTLWQAEELAPENPEIKNALTQCARAFANSRSQ